MQKHGPNGEISPTLVTLLKTELSEALKNVRLVVQVESWHRATDLIW
jgi:hypothetical protein